MCLLLCISVQIVLRPPSTQHAILFCFDHISTIFSSFSISLSGKFSSHDYCMWPCGLSTAHPRGRHSHWLPHYWPPPQLCSSVILPSFSHFLRSLCKHIYLIVLLFLQILTQIPFPWLSSPRTPQPLCEIKIYFSKSMMIYVPLVYFELCEGRNVHCSALYHSEYLNNCFIYNMNLVSIY